MCSKVATLNGGVAPSCGLRTLQNQNMQQPQGLDATIMCVRKYQGRHNGRDSAWVMKHGDAAHHWGSAGLYSAASPALPTKRGMGGALGSSSALIVDSLNLLPSASSGE
jgi:hypothetical protein